VALESNALTTLDKVNGELGFTTGSDTDRDARIEDYINEVSDLIERGASRRFYWVTGYTERAVSTGINTIRVTDHLPIDTINSITFDDGDTSSTVDSDLYEVAGDEQKDLGIIRRVGAATWQDTRVTEIEVQAHRVPGSAEPLYEVDYDGGYVTREQADNDPSLTRSLPYDLERAAIDYAIMQQSNKGGDKSVQKISMDDGSITFFKGMRVPRSVPRAIHRYTDGGSGLA